VVPWVGMRWRFAETEDEREKKAKLRDRMVQFWTSFGCRQAEISGLLASGESLQELGTRMKEELMDVLPALQFELTTRDGRPHLVITPEENVRLAPLVKAMIELAPPTNGWTFCAYRDAEPFERAQVLLQGRIGGDVRGWHVIVSRVDRRIRLRFLSPECHKSQEDGPLSLSYVAAQVLLGERVANDWIESVLVDPLPTRKAYLFFGKTVQVGTDNSIPVELMAGRVQTIIDEMMGELPEVPLHRHLENGLPAGAPIGKVYRLNHTKEELERRKAEGYPGQSDQLVAAHLLPSLFPAVQHTGFSSTTLSRTGETFCYLKIDGSEGLGNTYADRGELQEALDRALGPQELGCTLGGGTGVRYSYVELALRDVERGAGLIREVLRSAAIPRRSWLLFHDGELADEWLGIYPDSPPPPQSSTDGSPAGPTSCPS
jgi:hypothetical protein